MGRRTTDEVFKVLTDLKYLLEGGEALSEAR